MTPAKDANTLSEGPLSKGPRPSIPTLSGMICGARPTGGDMSLAEALAQPGDADFEFEPPRMGAGIFKSADLE